MKAVKIILLVVVILVAVVLIAAAIAPQAYEVEKEVTIAKPKADVFAYAKLLKNQDNFAVWSSMDPDMKKEFKGEDGTVGFVSAWESEDKNVGKGEQEITGIVEGERIEYELRFFEPFQTTDNAHMTFTAADSQSTVVKWGFNGKMPYPMNISMIFMSMESMLGDQLQQGLDKLKVILEEEQ